MLDECVSEMVAHQGAELGRYIYLLEVKSAHAPPALVGSLVMRDLCGGCGPPRLRGWLEVTSVHIR